VFCVHVEDDLLRFDCRVLEQCGTFGAAMTSTSCERSSLRSNTFFHRKRLLLGMWRCRWVPTLCACSALCCKIATASCYYAPLAFKRGTLSSTWARQCSFQLHVLIRCGLPAPCLHLGKPLHWSHDLLSGEFSSNCKGCLCVVSLPLLCRGHGGSSS
jgi:hypothetical protein